ncbi:protein sax-3 [Galendromus occidentalis]|uniref:Protein sax-3 n=1 Tax=Galendromus occidentalis TaxID=34638 RepID=A0AAJ7WIE7_9ACAR|nr:protein sax-3 [Galendromus occidentalis]
MIPVWLAPRLFFFVLITHVRAAKEELVVIEHPSDVVALRHDPAQLSCNVQGAKRINWFHKGRAVTSNGGTTVSLGTLFILSVLTHDTGVYWCEGVAENGKSVRSNNATLNIAYLREEFTVKPRSTEASIGGSVVLECTPPSGLPKPDVEWLKEGVPVNVGTGRSRLRLQGDNLLISEVRANDQGDYVCKAENIVGTRETAPAKLKVKLTSKPHIVTPPKDETVLAKEHASVRFVCTAGGDPSPRVRWRHGTRELNGDDRLILALEESRGSTTSTLEISDVNPDDHGNYTCEAENAAGRATSTSRLTVHYRPQFAVIPSSQHVSMGASVALRCAASGNPRPDVYWSRDSQPGKLLFPNNTYGRLSVDAFGTLLIPRLGLEDSGVYICTALSAIDTITATARVEVSRGGAEHRSDRHLLLDLVESPWLLLLVSAILCLILICVAVTILLVLRKMRNKTSAVTEVPVAKGGDINFFAALAHPTTTEYYYPPGREKMVLYENKLNIMDCNYPMECAPLSEPQRPCANKPEVSMPGPYASTTLVVGLPRNETGTGVHRRAFPVNGGAQGAHELENLLQGGYSNSGTSSSETSSFGQRSGRSSRSSSRPTRVRVQETTSCEDNTEPIYSLVPEDVDDESEVSQLNNYRRRAPPPSASLPQTPQLKFSRKEMPSTDYLVSRQIQL